MKRDLHLEGVAVTDHCGTTQNIGGQVAEEDDYSGQKKMKVTLGTTLAESEIADEVMTWEDEAGSEDKEEEETTCPKHKVISAWISSPRSNNTYWQFIR